MPERSWPPIDSVNAVLLGLYLTALKVALILVLPAIALIAAVGILIGLTQTLVGIQDQNLSFGPKIGAVAMQAAGCGFQALSIVVSLLDTAVAELPHLSH